MVEKILIPVIYLSNYLPSVSKAHENLFPISPVSMVSLISFTKCMKFTRCCQTCYLDHTFISVHIQSQQKRAVLSLSIFLVFFYVLHKYKILSNTNKMMILKKYSTCDAFNAHSSSTRTAGAHALIRPLVAAYTPRSGRRGGAGRGVLPVTPPTSIKS